MTNFLTVCSELNFCLEMIMCEVISFNENDNILYPVSGNYGIIYKITDPNGAIYIGKSKNWNLNKGGRFFFYKKAKCSDQLRIYNSIMFWGFDKLKIEILEHVKNKEDINDREIFYISKFNSYKGKHGMNLTPGGDGDHFTSEMRQKSKETALKRDKKVYKLYNMLDDIKFEGTKLEFYKRFNISSIPRLTEFLKGKIINFKHWVFEENIDVVKHSYEKHTFKNITTGEVFIGCKNDFIKKYKLKHTSVYNMILGKLSTTQNWIIEGRSIDINRTNHWKRKAISYSLTNIITGEIFNGTKHEFIKKYKFRRTSVYALIDEKVMKVNDWMLTKNVGYNFIKLFSEKTKEIYEGTIKDLCEIYGYSYSVIRSLIQGKHKHVYGWVLFENVGKGYFKDKNKIYKFLNTESGDAYEGTQSEFKKRFDFNDSGVSMLLNKKIKKFKNWTLND